MGPLIESQYEIVNMYTTQVGGEGFLDRKILDSMALKPDSGRLASWLVPPVQVGLGINNNSCNSQLFTTVDVVHS